ncbi:MAG: hypothetical protein Q8927_08590 [Bacteroidota bacterium]|nr:hypothetical protein [Bacteroidota bacterium]MDP4245491.1 hypothetical protein [Bacteroidota bacterium]MDP4259978.1 hypothetical protein [Bacteroidota bacterium]
MLRANTLFYLMFLWALAVPCTACSQSNCPQMPADCPVEDYPNLDLSEDSVSKLGNPIIPQEVAMEHFLRRRTTALMKRIAQKEGWEVTELSEGGASGYRDLPPHDTPLNYALRPPHWFEISFQFIINKDSLAAWAAWIKDLSERRLADVNQYASRMASVEDKRKAYMDSANYYGDLKANYMTAHMAGYQQALMSGSKSGTAAYEKAVDAYDKKVNYWINKATDLQKDASSEKRQSDAEEEKNSVGQRYHDATVVTVEFRFNGENALTNEAHAAGEASGSSSGGNPSGASGYSLARWYSNPKPYLKDPLALYTHSRNFVLLLDGPWNLHPDANGIFYPSFRSNKQAIDQRTPKSIKSDRIQAISIHIAGNKAGIGRVLADLSAAELRSSLKEHSQ